MLRPDPLHSAPPDRFSNPGGLTPREVEVLTLIAQGMNNQQIAAALFRRVCPVWPFGCRDGRQPSRRGPRPHARNVRR